MNKETVNKAKIYLDAANEIVNSRKAFSNASTEEVIEMAKFLYSIESQNDLYDSVHEDLVNIYNHLAKVSTYFESPEMKELLKKL